jgi:hypothetical protein
MTIAGSLRTGASPAASATRDRGARLAAGAVAAALALAPAAAPAAEDDRSLEEKVLDEKYRHGDYAVYLGWHDPWDWQFDEHGSFALPLGVKVRFKWLDWLRLEGDVSYYRRGDDPPVLVSLAEAPAFDGLMLGGSAQLVPWRRGRLRPYVGVGPMLVSLGNDFVVFRPEVREADPGNPDQFALASWSQLDAGWQVLGGVDVLLGHRVSPFLEFRQIFGELHLESGDVTIGTFPFDPEDLNTVPGPAGGDGVPHSRRYDWSGPSISGGLKVRF